MTTQFTNWMTEVRTAMEPGNVTGSKHPQYLTEDDSSPVSKRADTRNTPNRSQKDTPLTQDAPSIQLFWSGDQGAHSPLSPPTPHTAPMATTPDNPRPAGYHPLRPQYLYTENGDGSLSSVGLAGPSDYDSQGKIRGPRPFPQALINFEQTLSHHCHSPMQTQADSSEPESPRSLTGEPQSPQRSRHSRGIPSQSLPATGANLDHV